MREFIFTIFCFLSTSGLFADVEFLEVTKENFFKEIVLSKKPVIIIFYGQYCGPCNRLKPIISELQVEYQEQLQFVYINVTNEPEIATHFGVRVVPTRLFLRCKGIWPIVVKTHVGFRDKEDIASEIAEFLLDL